MFATSNWITTIKGKESTKVQDQRIAELRTDLTVGGDTAGIVVRGSYDQARTKPHHKSSEPALLQRSRSSLEAVEREPWRSTLDLRECCLIPFLTVSRVRGSWRLGRPRRAYARRP
jgi:hypothetical protein